MSDNNFDNVVNKLQGTPIGNGFRLPFSTPFASLTEDAFREQEAHLQNLLAAAGGKWDQRLQGDAFVIVRRS